MTGAAVPAAAGGHTRRAKAPWVQKRRRLLMAIGLMLLLVLPAFVWRARLAGDVREKLASLEARGLPLTLEALDARLPAIPGGDTAASRYLEASRLYQDGGAEQRRLLPFVGDTPLAPRGPLAPESLDAMRALVAANGPALAALREASRLPETPYYAHYGFGADTARTPVSALIPLAPLLCCQALLYAESGDAGNAIETLIDALALSRSLATDGLALNLAHQWNMQQQLLQALERVLNVAPPPAATLTPFVDDFTPGLREAQVRRMLETETCLFVARLRGRTRGGIFKSVIVSAGVGDINLRAYLQAADIALGWPEATFGERALLETQYADVLKRCSKHPLLFVTLERYSLPARWAYFRDQLDRAAVAQAGLALYRYQQATGRYPEEMDALAPAYLPEVPSLASTGGPVAYRTLPGGAEIHNGAEGASRLSFAVYTKGE